MGPTSFFLCAAFIALVLNQGSSFGHEFFDSKGNDVGVFGNMEPLSFTECSFLCMDANRWHDMKMRQQDRPKRQVRPGGLRRAKGPGHGPGQGAAAEGRIVTLNLPKCHESGVRFMSGQGGESYYLKCVRNNVHGGYFRVIYLCPKDSFAAADRSRCMPPPDCSNCGMNRNDENALI